MLPYTARKHESWRNAACITPEEIVIAKNHDRKCQPTQHEEIPNTHGFLAKFYDEDEESKIATKQLSTNVQC